MKVSKRVKELVRFATGEKDVWQYEDQAEHEFAFVMAAFTGFQLPNIDAFLEDKNLRQDIRVHLVEKRSEALDTYRQGDFGLAVAQYEALHHACLFYGQNIAVAPAVSQKRARAKQAKEAATAPRESARTVDHEEVEREFRRLRREGHTRREANGILANRGLAAASTIRNITNKIDD